MVDQSRRGRPKGRRPAEVAEASKAPAVARAVAILRLLGDAPTPLGVNSIARDLGLAPSTCFNVLRALAAEKLVALDPRTKQYSLAAGVMTLAGQWLRRNRFNDLAQPKLDRIGQAFDVAVYGLYFSDLDQVVVVAVSEVGSSIHFRSAAIGTRFPALISAAGRCAAAFGPYSEADLQARFATIHWDQPLTFEEWMAEVAQARIRRVAVDDGVFTSGMTVVAAPVCEAAGNLRYLLVAVGLSRNLRENGLTGLQSAVLSAAQELSSQI